MDSEKRYMGELNPKWKVLFEKLLYIINTQSHVAGIKNVMRLAPTAQTLELFENTLDFII